MKRATREWLVLAGVFVTVFAVLAILRELSGAKPWSYLLSVLITITIYAIFALALSLEFGQTGLLNLGQVAFMAIGAYTVAIFTERAGPSLRPALEGANAWGFVASLAVGLAAGATVAFLVNLALGRFFPAEKAPRRRTIVALAVGALVALVVLYASFPLAAQGAKNAVVFLAILVALLLAAGAGVLLGLPAVRLREDYLAIVTLGAAEILRSVVTNESQWTHGTLGILTLDRPVVDWALSSKGWNDFADRLDVRPVTLAHGVVFLLLLALILLVLQTLAKSPWGRVMKAIREDEEVAASLGKNVLAYKLQSLALGSAVAALAGIALSWHLSNVFPDHFVPLVTFYGFIIVVIGGIGNHRGAIAGAILLWGIFELPGNLTYVGNLAGSPGLTRALQAFVGPPQVITVGVLLILVMMFRPQGLLGRKEEMQFVK